MTCEEVCRGGPLRVFAILGRSRSLARRHPRRRPSLFKLAPLPKWTTPPPRQRGYSATPRPPLLGHAPPLLGHRSSATADCIPPQPREATWALRVSVPSSLNHDGPHTAQNRVPCCGHGRESNSVRHAHSERPRGLARLWRWHDTLLVVTDALRTSGVAFCFVLERLNNTEWQPVN